MKLKERMREGRGGRTDVGRDEPPSPHRRLCRRHHSECRRCSLSPARGSSCYSGAMNNNAAIKRREDRRTGSCITTGYVRA